jgi:ATP-dependent RNA helicase DHX8/PRP22
MTSELLRLQKLSLLGRVCSELQNHIGSGDKDLAEFVIHLADGVHTANEFHSTLIANGADFTPALANSLFALICQMDPSRAAAKIQSTSNSTKDTFERDGVQSSSGNRPSAKKYFGLAIPDSTPLSIEDAAAPVSTTGPRTGDKRKPSDAFGSSAAASSSSYPPDRFSAASALAASATPSNPFPFRQGPTPMVGDIIEGEVRNVKEFGAFVELKGYGNVSAASNPGGRASGPEALLHAGAIGKGKVLDLASVLKRGQRVKVKVIQIVGNKLSVSMKEVDQETGRDLRPKRIGDGSGSGGGSGDLHANPMRPHALSDPAARASRMADDEREAKRSGGKRLSSPERWEMTQLIASGAMTTRERPDVHEETGILSASRDEDEEDEVEVEINEVEPRFLEGQTAAGANMSPIKLVAIPDGSLQRAALTQSALSKERRELREQQKAESMDAVPADLARSWEDPMAAPGTRYLASSLKGIGASSEDVPEWKKEMMGKNVTYGRATTMSIKEQRESLPIYKLRSQLLQAIHDNQVLVVIGETGSGLVLSINLNHSIHTSCALDFLTSISVCVPASLFLSIVKRLR